MLEWKPPPKGGRLSYIFSIDHLRDDRAYDARCAKTWAIFRGQDLVPRMRVRTTRGALSDSVLRMRLPEGWSAALPYPRLTGGQYDLENSRTRFGRPTGWYAFGKLGVLREEFNGTRIAVVGPSGQGVRRMDALGLIKWTRPSLALLRRSKTLTTARYESAMEKISQRASPVTACLDGNMTSALRARSVVILTEIDGMIRNASGGASSLDDVVRVLVSSNESITPKRLRKAMKKVAGRKYDSFFDQLPVGR